MLGRSHTDENGGGLVRQQRIVHIALADLLGVSGLTAAHAAELPGHYFKLLEAELGSLDPHNLKSNPGAMLAAAVLYAKPHAANPSIGDKAKLELALRLGDLSAG
jgi:hypothetical protein